MKNKVSVAICCFNSAKTIERTLVSVFTQNLKTGLTFEVILVNNGSTDDTKSIAATVWKRHKETNGNQITFRIIDESRIGLSYARLRAAEESSSEIVIFCDDDNLLDADYVMIVVELFKSDERLGACGGIGEPVFDNFQLPKWFEDLNITLAWGPQGKCEGYLDTFTLYGAGMAIRRKILEQLIDIGYSPLLSDRSGDTLSSGGDDELTIWCKMMGYELYYCERLKFQHLIAKERVTQDYLKRLFRSYGISLARLLPLQIALFRQEDTIESSRLYQIVRWSILGIFNVIRRNSSLRGKKLDLITNYNRVAELVRNRRILGEDLTYVVQVRNGILRQKCSIVNR